MPGISKKVELEERNSSGIVRVSDHLLWHDRDKIQYANDRRYFSACHLANLKTGDRNAILVQPSSLINFQPLYDA